MNSPRGRHPQKAAKSTVSSRQQGNSLSADKAPAIEAAEISANATIYAANKTAESNKESSHVDQKQNMRTVLITAGVTLVLAAAGFLGSLNLANTAAENNKEQIQSLIDRDYAQSAASSRLSLDEYLRGNRIDYYIDYTVQWNAVQESLGRVEALFKSGTPPNQSEYDIRIADLRAKFGEFGRAETAALFLSSESLREKIEVIQRLANERVFSMVNAEQYVRGQQNSLNAPGLGSEELGDATFEMLEKVREELQGG